LLCSKNISRIDIQLNANWYKPLSILAFVAYIVIIVTASGSLRRLPLEKFEWERIDGRNVVAWLFALLSTFGLPWGGVPLTNYLGVGSWSWFAFAGVSMAALKNGVSWRCKLFAVANVLAIMAALCVFILENGVPGDIPGIEVIGAINSLEGFVNKKLILAYACFFISATASFLPHAHSGRASIMLSFSYASFLAIAFLPPIHMLFHGIRPDTAIIIDAAAYFIWALLIHILTVDLFSKPAASAWGRYYAILNAALTAAGICFLFTAV
jgi:hypothetical protein